MIDRHETATSSLSSNYNLTATEDIIRSHGHALAFNYLALAASKYTFIISLS